MAHAHSILVGIDFSKASEQALGYGVTLAKKLDSDLLLLHAWNPTVWAADPDVPEEAGTWVAEVRRSVRHRLEGWAERAREAGCRVLTLIESGPASRVVTDVALARGVRLAVLGRHGNARLAHVLLGSVSERVVRLGACPVLVVPAEAREGAPRIPERLLVGVDFSRTSRRAFEVARALATDLGARGLLLVHVAPGERELWLENWSEAIHRERLPDDASLLDAWARAARRTGLAIETEVVEGRAEPVLLERARTAGCDWLVLGVRGRTAVAALMGSTTDRILKLADRPILTVPSPVERPAADVERVP
jgi:nucleotide-binding universal stress UspA family protein